MKQVSQRPQGRNATVLKRVHGRSYGLGPRWVVRAMTNENGTSAVPLGRSVGIYTGAIGQNRGTGKADGSAVVPGGRLEFLGIRGSSFVMCHGSPPR